jgi:hypothetical protein
LRAAPLPVTLLVVGNIFAAAAAMLLLLVGR